MKGELFPAATDSSFPSTLPTGTYDNIVQCPQTPTWLLHVYYNYVYLPGVRTRKQSVLKELQKLCAICKKGNIRTTAECPDCKHPIHTKQNHRHKVIFSPCSSMRASHLSCALYISFAARSSSISVDLFRDQVITLPVHTFLAPS